MGTINKYIFILLLIILSGSGVSAQVRYHCAQDSVKVKALIDKAKEGETYGARIVSAAKALEGVPRGKAADNDSIGTLMIRLDSVNKRELIYYAMAAAKTAESSVATLREFEKNLEDISRRKGKDEGFASQFLYGSDWIVDNVYRGNLKEMTEYLESGNNRTKTLDYVSRHPEEFPAMADASTAEKVRIIEFGYRGHRIPHLKKQTIGNKNVKELIQNGDIIILNSLDSDNDIYDIGIVSIENGEPHLIHVSRESDSVVLDPYPVARLFKIEGQFFYGYRWLRPVE